MDHAGPLTCIERPRTMIVRAFDPRVPASTRSLAFRVTASGAAQHPRVVPDRLLAGLPSCTRAKKRAAMPKTVQAGISPCPSRARPGERRWGTAGSHSEGDQRALLHFRWWRKIGVRLCKQDVSGSSPLGSTHTKAQVNGLGFRLVLGLFSGACPTGPW